MIQQTNYRHWFLHLQNNDIHQHRHRRLDYCHHRHHQPLLDIQPLLFAVETE
jgi:hypothetical protein